MRIEKILSIPKSFLVSWRLMSFREALRLPILVRYNVVLKKLTGSVKIMDGCRLNVGFGDIPLYDKSKNTTILDVKGKIICEGDVNIGHSSRVSVGPKGVLTFGGKFVNTCAMTIVCHKSIVFGYHCTTSWDTMIMDTDFHPTINTISGIISPQERGVVLGNNVWCCARSVVLKGTHIPNGCILGASSVASSCFSEQYCVLRGNPAVVVKNNITKYED